MDEPTMETPARRLSRVKRENGRLKLVGTLALVVIAAVVMMGQAPIGKEQEIQVDRCADDLP